MMRELAIVGTGPAGMAAAALAAELGLATVLVDEQEAPGGQIYRGIERAPPDTPLGRDYLAGRPLVAALRGSRLDYRPATTVWHIDAASEDGKSRGAGGTLYLARAGRTETVTARRIVLATGAVERPVPIPGWTLPGVMTAGAAQILLKTADLVPEGRIVLAGQGPLVALVAVQLARAGAPPAVLLETTPFENYREAARRWRALWPGRRMLATGMGLRLALVRAGVPVRRGVSGLAALGRGALERVRWDGGEIAADHLLLHEGVIPNVQASLALGLRHEWDEDQWCWRPALDEWGRTSLSGVAIAGDGGGIAGAAAAVLSGRLAVLEAAAALGRVGEEECRRRALPIRAALKRERALRPFLDRLYRPPRAVLAPAADDVVVCRCEEVRVGEIRRAARLGAPGPNQAKAFTRCGMGPCQGRICGPIVAA
ncbi:MAG TPA: NAD(P)/FAD-dependent oxidoreductase, partial [Stellaceae bacterium]|nr:NAD(P)/FAD-dependent oxidoreductase [Stellaceae bacterium]